MAEVTINDLIGKVLVGVDFDPQVQEAKRVVFHCMTGERYEMLHHQDCCECVELHDICGDIADLHGLVIDAREEPGESKKEGEEGDYESCTWTFYVIQTEKGAVTLRWLGVSNGYYSEGVDFQRC
jgi:hypothetical protein